MNPALPKFIYWSIRELSELRTDPLLTTYRAELGAEAAGQGAHRALPPPLLRALQRSLEAGPDMR